jgi:hypothetical protein
LRQVTLELDDDALFTAVKTEAANSGRSLQEIVAEALTQWLADAEADEKEREQIDDASKEWRERGGIEAREFFSSPSP